MAPPLVQLTLDQADALKTLTSIMSWTGAVLSAVVVALNVLDPRKRRFPARLTTNFAAAALVFNLAIGIGALVGYRQLPDPRHPPDSEYKTLCKIQGALVHYLANAMSAWWLCLSRIVYDIVVGGKEFARLQRMERSLHLFAWGFPLLLTIVPAAAGQLGPVDGAAWCQVKIDHYSAFLLFTFYFWMGSYLVVGATWAARTVATLRQLRHDLAAGDGRGPRVYSYMIQRQVWSVAIFMLVFAVMFAWGMALAIAQWHGSHLSFGFALVAAIAANSPGIDSFLLFGLTRTTYTYLRARNLCSCLGTPQDARMRGWSEWEDRTPRGLSCCESVLAVLCCWPSPRRRSLLAEELNSRSRRSLAAGSAYDSPGGYGTPRGDFVRLAGQQAV